jgi:hypothetical protein
MLNIMGNRFILHLSISWLLIILLEWSFVLPALSPNGENSLDPLTPWKPKKKRLSLLELSMVKMEQRMLATAATLLSLLKESSG